SPLPSRGRGNGEACAVRYSVSRCGTSQYPSPPRGEGKGSRLLVAPTSSPLSSLYPQAPAQSVELLPADASTHSNPPPPCGQELGVEVIATPAPDHSFHRPRSTNGCKHALRHCWHLRHPRTARMAYRVQDGWCGRDQHMFAKSLRAIRTFRIRHLNQNGFDRRHVANGWNEVVVEVFGTARNIFF